MKNRIVGFIILGIAALIGFITWTFNSALTKIVNTSCTHGVTCPMWGDIKAQTNISVGIIVFVVIIAWYLIFFGKEEKIVTQVHVKKIKVKEQIKPKAPSLDNYKKVMASLDTREKRILTILIEEKGSAMQSTLVNKTGLTKVSITRILDKLESMQLIERKRRGMTNIVILKNG